MTVEKEVSSWSVHMQNGLGLKGFLSGRGCEYITTDKKEGPDNGMPLAERAVPHMSPMVAIYAGSYQTALLCAHCSAMHCRRAQPCSVVCRIHHARAEVDKLLPSTDILITTPFHPVRPLTTSVDRCVTSLRKEEVKHAGKWHVAFERACTRIT